MVPAFTLSEIQAEPAQDTLCLGSLLTLKVSASLPGVEYVWSENGVPIPDATLDSLNISPSGAELPVTVQYAVVATDEYGCTVSRTFDQVVKPCFVFPNVFTPDNDDINDTFSGIKTYGGELDVVEFRVYNRWGKKVFEATDNIKAWDGKIDGQEAPMDVYAFYITIQFGNGSRKTFQGDVTLLR